MTDFYHRYRSLFELNNSSNPLSFSHKKPLFQSARKNNHEHKSTFTPQPEFRKQSHFNNLSRSPALEEFQSAILPRLNKKYPIQTFKRLETQIKQPNKFTDELQSNGLGINFYQLPKVAPFQPEIHKRERILTQETKPYQSRFKFKNVKNKSKKLEDLQKQYLKYYPKKQDTIKQQIQEKPAGYDSRARVKTQHPQITSSGFSPFALERKWEVKILPEKKSYRHFQGLIPSPKHHENKNIQFKEYQDRQNQLYGIKENPYAFVNSKLEQIKRSQKYYPRGHINSYRDALFRRRKNKNMIEERRQKLRNILYEQDIKYGVL